MSSELEKCKLSLDSLKKISQKLESGETEKDTARNQLRTKRAECDAIESSISSKITENTPSTLSDCTAFMNYLKNKQQELKSGEEAKNNMRINLRSKRQHCNNLDKLSDRYIKGANADRTLADLHNLINNPAQTAEIVGAIAPDAPAPAPTPTDGLSKVLI